MDAEGHGQLRCPTCGRVHGDDYEDHIEWTRGQRTSIQKPITSGSFIWCSRCGQKIYLS